MTDLLRLATELERSGGVHRLTALINCAVRVAMEHERGVTVRGERWPLPVVESNARPCWTDAPHFSQRGADCQDEPSITHAPDSPIPELVREPARRCVPRYPNPEDDGA